eukprot:COSAG06_NODE_40666_length_399_cov_27.620000_1_plen_58_part_10
MSRFDRVFPHASLTLPRVIACAYICKTLNLCVCVAAFYCWNLVHVLSTTCRPVARRDN